jgi:carbon monoxide dehydrogenase subunit G
MKAIRQILLWLLGIATLLFVVGFFLPNSIAVERKATIAAPVEAVHALLNDMKTYDKWMTWNQMDPGMKKVYGPQSTGLGAWYSWDSNNSNVGKGKMTISESMPFKIVTKMEFQGMGDDDPALGIWELTPNGNNTDLKWQMKSKMSGNPLHRWMGLFMDKMVGNEFEKGLANINKLARTGELALPSISAQTDSIPLAK